MQTNPEPVNTEELLTDLLSRVQSLEARLDEPHRPTPEEDERDRRLVVSLAGIDRSVASFQAKQRDGGPWTSFDLPDELEGERSEFLEAA